MSGARFTSAFAADLEGYLAFKQNMGCYGASRIWYLRQFDAWCAEHGRTVFDQGTVEGWVAARLESSGRYRSWMSYVRDFGRWLQATGHDDACVLSDRWKAPFIPPRPYLLSRQEIEAFFTAAATLDTSSPWRWQAAAFFTLMHSCGLRTGETRALKTAHVDLDLREHRHRLVQGKPQPQAAGHSPGRAGPGGVRRPIPRPVFRPGELLRLRHRQPGHRGHGRSGICPDLGRSRAGPATGRPAASALRIPASLRLRVHRAVADPG